MTALSYRFPFLIFAAATFGCTQFRPVLDVRANVEPPPMTDADSILWTCTTSFWLFALCVACLKIVSPSFDAVLRYGRLRGACVGEKAAGNSGVVLLVQRVSQRNSGLSSREGWTSFYVVGTLAGWLCLFVQQTMHGHDSGFVLFLFILQTSRRLCECLFVHKFSESDLSLLHLLLGSSFYVAVPATILVSEVRTASSPSPFVRDVLAFFFLFFSATLLWEALLTSSFSVFVHVRLRVMCSTCGPPSLSVDETAGGQVRHSARTMFRLRGMSALHC